MLRTAGREIPAEPAVLDDYACYIVRYQYYPAAVPMTGASISGLLYSGLTPDEFSLLDSYEGTEYRRTRVSVMTGQGRQAQAWVYIIRPRYQARLSDRKFDLEEFLKTEAQALGEALRRNRIG
jgi:gamma-glutamylcyclotransferase (GGCT)/AIG2-like uncharacterized protein YtfP